MWPGLCAEPSHRSRRRIEQTPRFQVATEVQQLSLGMRLQDRAVFTSFYPGNNTLVVGALQDLAAASGERSIFLHGAPGSGKSHLLQAVCAAVTGGGYFPLGELAPLGAAVFEGAERLPLVAVDDLDAVAGDRHWDQALFRLYNELLQHDGRLLIAALRPPLQSGVALPDLRSRLAAMTAFVVQPLDEMQQRAALQLRAGLRGIELPEETLIYLQRRYARDMPRLHALLDRLDLASLAAQRRLTVPFIRAVLDEAT
jgi:DnaA family protein